MSLDGASTLSLNTTSNSKPTKESMNKIIRTKRKENDLRRMLHSYDLTNSNPNQVKRLAEVFDDIGTRSSCPTHLIYSPKKMSLKVHDRPKPEYIKGLKDHAADKINYVDRLEAATREYAEKIEKMKDLIETDVEDIDFLKQQMQAQKERIASHQDAPRAQERDAEAGMILPVTGYNNASQLNKRMVEKSLAQLVKRIMNKRAEVNDAIGENNKIKYVIDNLRRERHTYKGIITELHEELTNIKTTIKNDEEYIEQTNNDRRDLNNEINNANHERDEMTREAQGQLQDLEEKRLEEIRLDKIASEAADDKRRKEKKRKRDEAKARRNKAREEHQRQHDAHLKSKKGAFDFSGDSSLDSDMPSHNSLNGGESTLSNIGSMVSSTQNVGGVVMEEMYNEWNTTWNTLLDGTSLRTTMLSEIHGNADQADRDASMKKRRPSMRPGRQATSPKGSVLANLSSEELNSKMRNRLCYELRTNADSDFQQLKQVNELKNNRDALLNEIREIDVTLRQLERNQKGGGTDDADLGTVKLIKRLEQEVSRLERVVGNELDSYNSNLAAVDTFCDEITTCYLRTGAGGGESNDDGGPDAEGGEAATETASTENIENTPGSPNPNRRRSSSGFDGSEGNDGSNEESKGSPVNGNESTILESEVSKLKPQHYRALDNLKAIEQHVKNTIYEFAAQPMAMTAAAGALSNSLSSATNLLSPHQQAQHQIHQLSPKEREALIESRLGSMSSITSTRTIEQKIPRVDIPDDMEGAFGFDPDGGLGYDKPFLRDEVSDQLERQLAQIKEEASARMILAASLGNTTESTSKMTSSGLINVADKIRAEKEAMYERVAMLAISEQQEHHAAAMRLEAKQEKKLSESRKKNEKNSKNANKFKGDGNGAELTIRSVEMV